MSWCSEEQMKPLFYGTFWRNSSRKFFLFVRSRSIWLNVSILFYFGYSQSDIFEMWISFYKWRLNALQIFYYDAYISYRDANKNFQQRVIHCFYTVPPCFRRTSACRSSTDIVCKTIFSFGRCLFSIWSGFILFNLLLPMDLKCGYLNFNWFNLKDTTGSLFVKWNVIGNTAFLVMVDCFCLKAFFR